MGINQERELREVLFKYKKSASVMGAEGDLASVSYCAGVVRGIEYAISIRKVEKGLSLFDWLEEVRDEHKDKFTDGFQMGMMIAFDIFRR